MRRYCCEVLDLAGFFDDPGDGRHAPQIAPSLLIWTLLGAKVLRESAYAAVERLTRNAGRAFELRRAISNDTLANFTDAYWFTNVSIRRAGSKLLYQMAKSRWGIENQGFNEAKNLYGLAHLPRHHPNSLLVHFLLTALALTIERLYRLRNLHRGGRQPYTAIELYTRLVCSLSAPLAYDTS